MNLKNKNILITGAGKGIGESAVRNFLKNDGYVYALIKSKSDVIKFKNLKNIHITVGDVTDTNLIEKIMMLSIKQKKPINCLVNNAGVRFRKKFDTISKKELLKVFEINFFSIFKIMQVISRHWVKKKISGNIINIASIVGQLGFRELSVYASTKGALISLTKSFAVEYSKYNIRANTVSPGFTKTSYYENFKKKSELFKWTLSRIPQERWGEPEEIANILSFLLSEKCTYLNGENINIDGGWISS